MKSLISALALAAVFSVPAIAKVPTGVDVKGPADYVLTSDNKVIHVEDCKDPKVWRNPMTEEVSCLFEPNGEDEGKDDED